MMIGTFVVTLLVILSITISLLSLGQWRFFRQGRWRGSFSTTAVVEVVVDATSAPAGADAAPSMLM
jgi:hypothetical protein